MGIANSCTFPLSSLSPSMLTQKLAWRPEQNQHFCQDTRSAMLCHYHVKMALHFSPFLTWTNGHGERRNYSRKEHGSLEGNGGTQNIRAAHVGIPSHCCAFQSWKAPKVWRISQGDLRLFFRSKLLRVGISRLKKGGLRKQRTNLVPLELESCQILFVIFFQGVLLSISHVFGLLATIFQSSSQFDIGWKYDSTLNCIYMCTGMFIVWQNLSCKSQPVSRSIGGNENPGYSLSSFGRCNLWIHKKSNNSLATRQHLVLFRASNKKIGHNMINKNKNLLSCSECCSWPFDLIFTEGDAFTFCLSFSRLLPLALSMSSRIRVPKLASAAWFGVKKFPNYRTRTVREVLHKFARSRSTSFFSLVEIGREPLCVSNSTKKSIQGEPLWLFNSTSSSSIMYYPWRVGLWP